MPHTTDQSQKVSPIAAAMAVIYTAISSLFVIKFIPRAGINPFVGAAAYIAALAAAMAIGAKLKKAASGQPTAKIWRIAFIATAILILLTSAALLIAIDKNALKVDRWSAISGFLDRLFDGQYPYQTLTHLGKKASPMPMIHFMAIPGYLIGDVGLLQPLVLAVFAFMLTRLKDISAYARVFALALIMLSPAYWWEVAARSDLLSNMLVVITVLMAFERSQPLRTLQRPILAAILIGASLATRGVVAIPLIIYFFAKVCRARNKAALIFCVVSVATFAAIFVPFILWDVKLFIENNPLLLQTNKTPFYIQAAGLAASVVLSFKAASLRQTLAYTAMLIFAIMTFTFIKTCCQYGYNETLYRPYFDISYFNAALPFAITAWAMHAKPQPGKGRPIAASTLEDN